MKKIVILISLFALLFATCGPGSDVTTDAEKSIDLTAIAYTPQPFTLAVPPEFPPLDVPAGYQFDRNIVELGRYLFYDKRLSRNNSLACASCHLQTHGFSDPNRQSTGVEGGRTARHSMALQNLAFRQTEQFWDGRVKTLEQQAALPVEDPIELHENWANVEQKLRKDTLYHRLFRQAFGIKTSTEITKDRALHAIAMFERTIIVGPNSQYWKMYVTGTQVTNDDIEEGRKLFFNTEPDADAQCFHCHDKPLFKGGFENNGLDAVASLNDFTDKGRGKVTGELRDNGKFRAPTLWNIALTAPYMHDGRFATLDEVIEHYAAHINYADNMSTFLRQVGNPQAGTSPPVIDPLDAQQKAQIKLFLLSLTDTISLKNPAYQNPFAR